MPKGVKLGSRTIIMFRKATGKKLALYSLPLKKVCDHFGIKGETSIPGRKNKKGVIVFPRGSKGAGSIQFPVDNGKTDTKSKADKMMSFPLPSGATHADIIAFVNTRITKNKPQWYISRDGQTRIITSK